MLGDNAPACLFDSCSSRSRNAALPDRKLLGRFGAADNFDGVAAARADEPILLQDGWRNFSAIFKQFVETIDGNGGCRWHSHINGTRSVFAVPAALWQLFDDIPKSRANLMSCARCLTLAAPSRSFTAL